MAWRERYPEPRGGADGVGDELAAVGLGLGEGATHRGAPRLLPVRVRAARVRHGPLKRVSTPGTLQIVAIKHMWWISLGLSYI